MKISMQVFLLAVILFYAGNALGNDIIEITEWPVPDGAGAKPYGMAVDDKDRLWFVECGPQPNRFVGFDPHTQKFFSTTEIKSGGGCVRYMFFHAPSGEIWFGTDRDTIGRAKIP